MRIFMIWFVRLILHLRLHKDLVVSLAETATILEYFAGVIVCNDIYKKGSTRGFTSVPFIGGTAIGILSLQYGVIIQDELIIGKSLLAVFLNVIYTVFYYVKSNDRNSEIVIPIGGAVPVIAFISRFFSGIARSDRSKVELFVIILSTSRLVLRGIMPLMRSHEIIRRRDASIIPFPITIMYTAASFFWFLYGVMLLDLYLVVMTVLGLFFCLPQLLLVYIYRPRIRRRA